MSGQTPSRVQPRSARDGGRGSRLHHVDGLRAVAALWVVCNHVWLTIYPDPDTDGGARSGLGALLTRWMVYGHFAVVAFIVLSGYSLAIATERAGHRLDRGFLQFVRRRFIRIVLPYWGALAISLVLAVTVLSNRTGTHWDAALPVTDQGMALHLILLQDIATTGQINHALWSIAIEWHIYFLFPLLLWLRRRAGLLAATATTVTLGMAVSACFSGGLTLWAEANLIGCFAIGVAARELAARAGRPPLTRRRPPWGVLSIGLAATLIGLCLTGGTHRSNTLTEPLVGAVTGCLLVALAGDRSRWLRHALSWRPLTWIGSFSYSLYLLHAPLLQLIWQYVMRPLGMPLHDGYALLALLALGIPASVGLGWGYFRAVERRCLGSPARTHQDEAGAS